MKHFFKLYTNCIPVKGAQRSVICDLQHGKLKFIPNDLFDILDGASCINIPDLIKTYGEENKAIIAEYLEYLVDHDFGFWCRQEELDNFPKLDLQFKSPYQITNVIIDHQLDHPYPSILSQLDKLGSVDLEIRFFDMVTLDVLKELAQLIRQHRVKSVSLIIKFNQSYTYLEALKLIRATLKVCNVTVHTSPFDRQVMVGRTPVMFTTQKITDETHCGIIDRSYFEINPTLFMESVNFNSCLNRKLSIDQEGNIKNCPSMEKTYGKVDEVLLKDALNDPDFKKVWHINKDQVEVCMDCEFRHVCTDCRAYLEEPDNFHSKPLKCGYNPYTNEWSDWSSDRVKQKGIAEYGFSGLPDTTRLQ